MPLACEFQLALLHRCTHVSLNLKFKTKSDDDKGGKQHLVLCLMKSPLEINSIHVPNPRTSILSFPFHFPNSPAFSILFCRFTRQQVYSIYYCLLSKRSESPVDDHSLYLLKYTPNIEILYFITVNN